MSAQACFLQSSRLSHAVAHALGCAALLLPAAALAQAPGVLSPGVQLQEQLRQFENSPAPGTGNEVHPLRDDQDDSEAQDSEQTMSLKGIRFEGNFKYDSDELIQPFLGLIGEFLLLSCNRPLFRLRTSTARLATSPRLCICLSRTLSTTAWCW